MIPFTPAGTWPGKYLLSRLFLMMSAGKSYLKSLMSTEILAPRNQPDVVEDWLGEGGVSMMRGVLFKVDPVIVKVTLTLDGMG